MGELSRTSSTTKGKDIGQQLVWENSQSNPRIFTPREREFAPQEKGIWNNDQEILSNSDSNALLDVLHTNVRLLTSPQLVIK